MLLFVAFYISIPLAISLRTEQLFAIMSVWIVYACFSCCCNASTKYISNVVDLKQVFININNAIAARPICVLHIQNYHYENRTYTDSKGRTHTRRVRVNTHAANENMHFRDWVDRSPPASALAYIDVFLLTRIYTFKYIVLGPVAKNNLRN